MLIGNLRRHPRAFAWLIAWSLVQALPSMATGWVVAKATQEFLAGRTADGIGWLGLLVLAAIAGGYGGRQAFLRLGAIVEPFRDELVEIVVAGALARSMDPASPPDIGAVGRLTHQAEIVRDTYAGVLLVACMFGCTVGSSLAGLVTLVPATLPYVVPPLLASLVVVRLLLRPFAVRQRGSVIGEETVAQVTAAAVSGVKDVTACGAEDRVLATVTASVRQQADAARSVARIGAARVACVTAGGWLPLLLVLAAGPSLLRHGVSPAYLIGAIAYIVGSLRSTLYTLSQGVGASMVRLTVTLDRILEAGATADPRLPDLPDLQALPDLPALTDLPTLPALPALPARGVLRLRNVTFGYGRDAEPVIRDLSIDIPHGEHLAIVGPSGIGKSSLAGLLAGMLTPTSGEITLDAGPVARCHRVLIPQEAYVFAGTLGENIRYLRPGAAELDAAAEAVGLRPLVSRLGGYETVIAPSDLSAGERQLIALARAYLSTAPIVILDEATCHLDPAAEAHAETAFARRPGTLIVIAHRISSAMHARRVLVLDGASPQCGDHASLLVSSAMYRDLVGYWTNPSIHNDGARSPGHRSSSSTR